MKSLTFWGSIPTQLAYQGLVNHDLVHISCVLAHREGDHGAIGESDLEGEVTGVS